MDSQFEFLRALLRISRLLAKEDCFYELCWELIWRFHNFIVLPMPTTDQPPLANIIQLFSITPLLRQHLRVKSVISTGGWMLNCVIIPFLISWTSTTSRAIYEHWLTIVFNCLVRMINPWLILIWWALVSIVVKPKSINLNLFCNVIILCWLSFWHLEVFHPAILLLLRTSRHQGFAE